MYYCCEESEVPIILCGIILNLFSGGNISTKCGMFGENCWITVRGIIVTLIGGLYFHLTSLPGEYYHQFKYLSPKSVSQ